MMPKAHPNRHTVTALSACLVMTMSAMAAPEAGTSGELVCRGLVGVGRIPHDAFDMEGGKDGQPGKMTTLGGCGSGMAVVPGSVRKDGAGNIVGELVLLADRGFADGIAPYRPRYHVAEFVFAPASAGAAAGASAASGTAQDQLKLKLKSTTKFIMPGGEFFRGTDAGPGPFDAAMAGTGANPPALPFFDPEAVVLLPGPGDKAGGKGIAELFISEEYGPSVYRFSPDGKFLGALARPAGAIPLDRDPTKAELSGLGWKLSFGTRANPEFGRRSNNGLEGLTLMPDGYTLVGMMQGPLMQDGAEHDGCGLTHLYTWDIKPGSPTYGQITGDYITRLPLYNSGKQHKPNPEKANPDKPTRQSKPAMCSEILAIGPTQLLAIERDNLGAGSDKEGPVIYKHINIIDLAGATNLLGKPVSGSPLQSRDGAPSPGPANIAAMGFGTKDLPADIIPAKMREFVNLAESSELAKFGMNANGTEKADKNTIGEKWEGLALIDAMDPLAPGDQYLIVASDNDFKTPQVFFEGQRIGQSRFAVDTMFLVYRIGRGK